MNLVRRLVFWWKKRGRRRQGARRIIPRDEAVVILAGGARKVEIPWVEITEITVFTRDVLIPSDFRSLLIAWGGCHFIDLQEDVPGWMNLARAVETHLSSAVPSDEWLLRILADPQIPITIYKRS